MTKTNVSTAVRGVLREVTIVDSVHLDGREAAFLRNMAQHCIAARIPGFGACESLVRVLDRMQVPMYDGGPVHGLFEEDEIR